MVGEDENGAGLLDVQAEDGHHLCTERRHTFKLEHSILFRAHSACMHDKKVDALSVHSLGIMAMGATKARINEKLHESQLGIIELPP